MTWAYRNMVVADSVVETCRSLAQLLAGEGQVLWTTPLSADGQEPATHWISSGLIEDTFAALLPLSEWTWVIDDEETGEGHWEKAILSPGHPETIVQMCAEAGLEVTLTEVEDLLNASDVTLETPQQSWTRLGLQLVQPEEESEV